VTAPRTPGEERLRRFAEPEKELASGTRTLVIGPYLQRRRPRSGAKPAHGSANPRPPEARLEEAVGLALAIDLQVTGSVLAFIDAPRPSTLLGKGKVEEIKGRLAAEEIGLVVMDGALSPVQQRNLEKEWGAKVIDRTGLILEIFGRRARTREGALQVELAHLSYQKGRLVRSWTHLERQRGGFGFLGGPGETQIEADRRLIQERMTRIERELETVTQTRALHRASRRKVPYPIVALVGYTNAGKSTLFNHLTSAGVLAENMLFATLDPTSRAVALPHGERIILSDTVGFISDLPTMLVAAFRATLEDVIEADVLLHVRDISAPETEAEAADVQGVLRDLGIGEDSGKRIIEVWNKADLLPEEDRRRLGARVERLPEDQRPALVSAVTGEGLDRLRDMIELRLTASRPVYRLSVDPSDGQGLAWLHEETEVLERRDDEEGRQLLVIRTSPEKEPRLLRRFPVAERVSEQRPRS
jgi:GTP-binding protein HflX